MSFGNSPADSAEGKQRLERLTARADAYRAGRLAGANHSCDACSNACGHTARNQAASRIAPTALRTILATELAKRRSARKAGPPVHDDLVSASSMRQESYRHRLNPIAEAVTET